MVSAREGPRFKAKLDFWTGFLSGAYFSAGRGRAAAASLTRHRCNACHPRNNAGPPTLQAQRQRAGDVVPFRDSATSLTRRCSSPNLRTESVAPV